MENIQRAFYESPIGLLEIRGTSAEILWLGFVETKAGRRSGSSTALRQCRRELSEYFRGTRKTFSVKLRLEGTDFQKRVWSELVKVGYGRTASYRDIALAAGRPKAVRAVGNANGSNPISIIVPCHRIIGSNGKLVGYGGGLWRKEWLLQHERKKTR